MVLLFCTLFLRDIISAKVQPGFFFFAVAKLKKKKLPQGGCNQGMTVFFSPYFSPYLPVTAFIRYWKSSTNCFPFLNVKLLSITFPFHVCCPAAV